MVCKQTNTVNKSFISDYYNNKSKSMIDSGFSGQYLRYVEFFSIVITFFMLKYK